MLDVDKPDEDGYVNFTYVANRHIGRQSQYTSRYVDGRLGYPNLGEGLRFKGDPADYHSLRIHQDDIAEFARRVFEHTDALGLTSPNDPGRTPT